MRRRFLVGKSRHGAHQSLAIVAHFPTLFIENHDESIALHHSTGHALTQTAVILGVHLELVNHHLDVVVLVSIKTHTMRYLHHLSINTHIKETLASHLLEELAVMSLAGSYQRCQNKDGLSFIIVENEFYDLLFGILHHLLARLVGVGLASSCKEQAQVVIHLGDGAHRRARILIGRLLFDGDDG